VSDELIGKDINTEHNTQTSWREPRYCSSCSFYLPSSEWRYQGWSRSGSCRQHLE
jgi:hypothetical protein